MTAASPLDPAVQALIARARIVAIQTGSTDLDALLRRADDANQYLSDADLLVIRALQPAREGSVAIASLLRDQAGSIVGEARQKLLEQHPDLVLPGGGLHPPQRAAACWRDLWQFLRCITYGVAIQTPEFTSPEGLSYLEQLYQHLQVPLAAMVQALTYLRDAALERIPAQQRAEIDPYFSHLIEQLRQFHGAGSEV